MNTFLTINKNNFSPIFLNSHILYGKNNTKINMHSHNVYHIILFQSGKGYITLGNENFEVGAKDLLFISSSVPHGFLTDKKKPYLFSQFTFKIIDNETQNASQFPFSKILKQFFYNLNNSVINLNNKAFHEIQSIISEFVSFGDNPPKDEAFINRSSIMLLSALSRISFILSKEDNFTELPIEIRVQKYLEKNYYKDISLEQIATEVAVSKCHLSRQFKEKVGYNIFDVLNNIRLKTAKNLLKYSFYSLVEIAERTGFNDVFYFSQCFKKKYKMPPGQFRKKG